MLDFFANPGFLAVAGVLISAPIIIHLINRMRYKRVRWAAMEFLLKAQKRMRKRLIIEQLLLLALRCLLVGLVGLLVCNFIGFSFGNDSSKPHLHIVLLDDTLSMRDQWKDGDVARDCFQMAKNDFLQDRIAKGLTRAAPNDELIVIPLSQVAGHSDAIFSRRTIFPNVNLLSQVDGHSDYQPKRYDHLNDSAKFDELKKDIAELQPSMLHADMLLGVKKAQAIIADNAKAQVTVHILSDFRQKEWSQPRAEDLYKSLVAMGQASKDTKILLYDATEKARAATQGGYPPSHDNVGIIDLRPSTKIVGKGMPVNYALTVANYGGSQAEVNVQVRSENDGTERFEANFTPALPLKVPPGDTVTVSFDLRFTPTIKAGETYFANISAKLLSANRGELPNDGLLEDNVRYAAVEVRERVPVLVIDGLGAKGREENRDSYHIYQGLFSVPSNRKDAGAYEVVYGDVIAGGLATRALERGDLQKYPSIFILNVAELSPKQTANLENYVREGGGVAFFMGPQVNADAYNKKLYRGGEGVFPVPLKESYFPAPNQDPLPEGFSETPRILLRDDQFPDPRAYPIFGPAEFDQSLSKKLLGGLSIFRYFPVPRAEWRPEPGRVFELATLPNDNPITAFQKDVFDLTRGADTAELLAKADYAKYRAGLETHFRTLERLVGPGSELKAYQLAPAVDALLTDRGKADDKTKERAANLTEFWSNTDPKVQALRRAVVRLRDEARFGDVFVVGGNFGKGRVVAVMTTAGKDWNNWGGGSLATPLYPGFIWETQNFLSSQGGEANLTVGAPVEITVEAGQFKQNAAQLTVKRTYLKPEEGKPAKAVAAGELFGKEVDGKVSFHFDRSLEPGLYITELRYVGDSAPKAPLAVYGHVFNVDTPAEGPLQRVSSDDLERDLMQALAKDQVTWVMPGAGGDTTARRTELSESPWFFLLLLCVLVAEQALAVHLSFHLKGSENEVLAKVTKPAAAA